MSIDFSQAYIKNLSIHFVGNKTNHIETRLSEKQTLLDSEMALRMKDFFLKNIVKQVEKYQFSHVESLEYNEIYNFIGEALTATTPFHEISKKVARHLHDKSEHPNIKPGEFYFVHFANILYDHITIEAIGIFKTENKQGFYQVNQMPSTFDIVYQEGIEDNKIDKGCLILDLDFESGFEVYLLDNSANKGDEAQYWKDEFLHVVPINDAYAQTKNFMNLAKDFVQFQVKKDVSQIEKADQIDMLNKSLNFFKSNDNFEQAGFEHQVLEKPEIVESFRDFAQINQYAYGLNLDEGFEISSPAVKKQAKIFKSVLKLDKNFHIYIHGDRSKIERGVDDNGKKFYKVYFDEES